MSRPTTDQLIDAYEGNASRMRHAIWTTFERAFARRAKDAPTFWTYLLEEIAISRRAQGLTGELDSEDERDQDIVLSAVLRSIVAQIDEQDTLTEP